VLLDVEAATRGSRCLRPRLRPATPLTGFSIRPMFQGGELIIIAAIALIVLGPTRLPELMRKAGEWTAELRNAAREISRGLESEVADLKAVGDDLKAPLEELKQPFKEIQSEVEDVDPRKHEWTGPKPVSGPTPEDAMRDLEAIEKAEQSAESEAEETDE